MPKYQFMATPILSDDKSLINKDLFFKVIAPNLEVASQQIQPLLSPRGIKAAFIVSVDEENITEEQFKETLAILGRRGTAESEDLKETLLRIGGEGLNIERE